MTTKSSKDSTHVDHQDWGEGRSVTAKPGSGGSRRDFLESTSLAAASALLAPRGLFAAEYGVAKTARTPGETTEATIQRPPVTCRVPDYAEFFSNTSTGGDRATFSFGIIRDLPGRPTACHLDGIVLA
jgi:hypothetical protein